MKKNAASRATTFGALGVALVSAGATLVPSACKPSQPDVIAPVAITAPPPPSYAAPIASARPAASEKPPGAFEPITYQGSLSAHPVGAKAPGFSVNAIPGGENVRLMRGEVTIVHFWATWCEPCKRSFKDLERLHEKYGSSGVTVIAISVDEESDPIAEFVKDQGAQFAVAWDTDKKVAEKYKPANMPSTYVIDREGIVRLVQSGYRPNDYNALDAEIRSLH